MTAMPWQYLIKTIFITRYSLLLCHAANYTLISINDAPEWCISCKWWRWTPPYRITQLIPPDQLAYCRLYQLSNSEIICVFLAWVRSWHASRVGPELEHINETCTSMEGVSEYGMASPRWKADGKIGEESKLVEEDECWRERYSACGQHIACRTHGPLRCAIASRLYWGIVNQCTPSKKDH